MSVSQEEEDRHLPVVVCSHLCLKYSSCSVAIQTMNNSIEVPKYCYILLLACVLSGLHYLNTFLDVLLHLILFYSFISLAFVILSRDIINFLE